MYRILRYRNCLNYITFISVFTKEDTSRLPAPVTYTNTKCSDVNFTISDVYEKLAKLCPDKAAGPDNLSPRFLLQIKDNVTHPLYLLFRVWMKVLYRPIGKMLISVPFTKKEVETKLKIINPSVSPVKYANCLNQ